MADLTAKANVGAGTDKLLTFVNGSNQHTGAVVLVDTNGQRHQSIDELVEALEPERQAKRANKKKVIAERYPAEPAQPVEIPSAGEIDLSAIKQAGEDAERALLVSGQIRTTVVQAVEDEAAVALLMMLLEGR